MARALLEEAGTGALWLSSDGRGLCCLECDPVAQANRPGVRAPFSERFLVRYDGTDFVQWHGRGPDGHMHPHGAILQLTRAGKSALRKKKARP